jgi:hypothetical protein
VCLKDNLELYATIDTHNHSMRRTAQESSIRSRRTIRQSLPVSAADGSGALQTYPCDLCNGKKIYVDRTCWVCHGSGLALQMPVPPTSGKAVLTYVALCVFLWTATLVFCRLFWGSSTFDRTEKPSTVVPACSSRPAIRSTDGANSSDCP